jgi:hypothetical protein
MEVIEDDLVVGHVADTTQLGIKVAKKLLGRVLLIDETYGGALISGQHVRDARPQSPRRIWVRQRLRNAYAPAITYSAEPRGALSADVLRRCLIAAVCLDRQSPQIACHVMGIDAG